MELVKCSKILIFIKIRFYARPKVTVASSKTKKTVFPRRAHVAGVSLKKKYGQHFLRDLGVTEAMLNRVVLDKHTSVFEIGCGDGFLTQTILARPLERLWVFEIDPEWVSYVGSHVHDGRMKLFNEDILSVDFERFAEHAPWVLLANLPYQITFPLLLLLEKHVHLLREGVVMVQEEVAQKIVATGGRPFGYQSLFFQHAFEWELLAKIPPSAFYPPPKVVSRLLYFKPRKVRDCIPDEERFWVFIKKCFAQPRRMLKHNLLQGGYDMARVPAELMFLRAQQLNKRELLALWELVR